MSAAELLSCWQSLARDVGPDYILSKTYTAVHSALFDAVSAESETVDLKLAGNQPILKNNRLQDSDVDILCQALKQFPGLLGRIDLSYNPLSDATVTYLIPCLQSDGCMLSELNLSYTDVTSGGAEALGGALQLNKSVGNLQLNGCKIEHRGGIALASMLQVNPVIHTLSLRSAHLDTTSVIAMATVLQANRVLRRVDLTRPIFFSVQEEPIIHFSKMLKVNSTLQELHLSVFSLTDTGAEWLCRGLQHNLTLTWLDISRNKLSRDGARHFATLLAGNPPLQRLNLSHNRIQDEGLQLLSKGLATNSNLNRLNVCYNSIGDTGLCALSTALTSFNLFLTKVTIWGNAIGEPTCLAFYELLRSKRLLADHTDVEPYQVDGVSYLAQKEIIE